MDGSQCSPDEAVAVVRQFMVQLGQPGQPDCNVTFSLLAIGETGRGADLAGLPDLNAAILAAFNHSSEEVKSAASYALGNIALGNLGEYLPFILHKIGTQPRRQAAPQVGSQIVFVFSPHHPVVFVLGINVPCPASGTSSTATPRRAPGDKYHKYSQVQFAPRTVVAECLGMLCLMSPAELLPKLKASLASPSEMQVRPVMFGLFF